MASLIDKVITKPDSGVPGECDEPVDKRWAEIRDLRKRYGRMRISAISIDHDAVNLSQMFAKLAFIPTRCEHTLHDNCLVMFGLSPLFDIIAEGEMVPEYVVECQNDADGNLESIKPCRKSSS